MEARSDLLLRPGQGGFLEPTGVTLALMDTAATTQEAVDAIVRNAVPPQGCWSDTDYLWLAGRLARHLEMTDGRMDPRTELVTVLTLSGDAYAEDGAYGRGDAAVSRVLDGFDVAVDAVFDFARR